METPGGIMVIDGVRYRRSSPTNITKLCCYERAGQQCDQAALSSQPLCGYHFSGRSMIQKVSRCMLKAVFHIQSSAFSIITAGFNNLGGVSRTRTFPWV